MHPKPQELREIYSVNEVEMMPLHYHRLHPHSLLTVSLTRSPAGLLRRVFAGKRFSHWLDSQSEQFLQNNNWINFEGPITPFINCIYICLKPLDVILCPQIIPHLNVLQNIPKTASNSDAKLSRVKTPLPGHCMPLYFVALDDLRLFIPSQEVRHFLFLMTICPIKLDIISYAFASSALGSIA